MALLPKNYGSLNRPVQGFISKTLNEAVTAYTHTVGMRSARILEIVPSNHHTIQKPILLNLQKALACSSR